MKIPNNIKIYRPKGCEIKFIGNNYYVYKVHSVYDKKLKRPKKITDYLVGKITAEEGLIPSEKYELKEAVKIPPRNKEYGGYLLTKFLIEEDIEIMKKIFKSNWKRIFFFSYIRLIYHSRLKMSNHYFNSSYFSISENSRSIGEKQLSELIKKIGGEREKILSYKKELKKAGEYLLIDSTAVFSDSNNLGINQHGYNSKRDYRRQINLLFIVSSATNLPIYYRILPGSIRDIKSLRISLQESGINEAVIIADKGFHSNKNVEILEQESLRYIMPLKRNAEIIDYSSIMKTKKEGFEGYFRYHGRAIWYERQNAGEKTAIDIFYNLQTKVYEEDDYLGRIEKNPEEYTLEKFRAKEHSFGTLTLFHNLKSESSEKIYTYYKLREGIEQVFDTFKNTLDADSTYMQNEESLEGLMFINFLAVRMYYKLMNIMREKEILSKYSPDDIINILKHIHKIKIKDTWLTSEITKKTEYILELIGLHIP